MPLRRKSLPKKFALLILVLVVLEACSRDPAKEKAAFLASGEKYAREDKYQEAVIQFRNAIEVDPRFVQAHHQLALVYIRMKAYQQAYRELLRTVELDSRNADAQLELAKLLLSGRKYDDAQNAAEKVIA